MHAVLSMMPNLFTNFLTCLSEPHFLYETTDGIPWLSAAVRTDVAAALVVVIGGSGGGCCCRQVDKVIVLERK